MSDSKCHKLSLLRRPCYNECRSYMNIGLSEMRLRYDHKRRKKKKENEWKISATVLSVSYNARAMHMRTHECIESIQSLSNKDKRKTVEQANEKKNLSKSLSQNIRKCHDRCRI